MVMKSKAKPKKRPSPGALSTSFLENCHKPVRRLTSDSAETNGRSRESTACESLSEIRPWLYLGSYSNALDRELLTRHGISKILNTAVECDSSSCEREEEALANDPAFEVVKLGIQDHADENISEIFSPGFKFIKEAKDRGEKVLVHCRRGISRSATLVIAYLIETERLTLDEAFNEVRGQRSIICPNLGFVLCLEHWERELHGKHASICEPTPINTDPQMPFANDFRTAIPA